LSADLVECLVHFGDDVETVEYVQGLTALLPDEVQIGLPHVRADKRDLGDDLLAHGREESLEGFDGPFLADPKQASDADVDLDTPGSGTCGLWRIGFHRRQWRRSDPACGAPIPRRRHVRPHRTPCPRKCESNRRFLSTKDGAPNGLGQAYTPWS